MTDSSGHPLESPAQAPSEPADVAVILVHGIGDQSQGSMLAQARVAFGDPTGPAATDPAGQCVTNSTPPSQPRWGDDTTVGGQMAARGLFRTRGTTLRLLVTEAWWDDVVHEELAAAPKPWRVWWWTVLALPHLLVFSGAIAQVASLRRHDAEFNRWPGKAAQALRWSLGGIQAVVVRLILLPPLLLVLVIVGTVIMVASRVTRGNGPVIRTMIRVCQLIIGDAWAYHQPALRERVLERVAAVYDAVATNANRIVVVGHSQGAALARLLNTRREPEVLVTIGSGAQILAASRTRRAGRMLYSWLVVLGFPAFFGFLTQAGLAENRRIVAEGIALMQRLLIAAFVDPFNATVYALEGSSAMLTRVTTLDVISWIIVVIALLVRRFIKTDPIPDELRTHDDTIWVDVTSIYDPVCVGGAGLEENTITVAVANPRGPHGIFGEHNQYFANPEVQEILRQVVVGDSVPPRWFARHDPHRMLRTSWLWAFPFTVVAGYAVGSAQLDLIVATWSALAT